MVRNKKAIVGIVILFVILVLGFFTMNPLLFCDIDIPGNYTDAIRSQSKGLYSKVLPLVPVYTTVEQYSDGIVYYTIHYFPFGTVGMSYREWDSYNIEKPLTRF